MLRTLSSTSDIWVVCLGLVEIIAETSWVTKLAVVSTQKRICKVFKLAAVQLLIENASNFYLNYYSNKTHFTIN